MFEAASIEESLCCEDGWPASLRPAGSAAVGHNRESTKAGGTAQTKLGSKEEFRV